MSCYTAVQEFFVGSPSKPAVLAMLEAAPADADGKVDYIAFERCELKLCSSNLPRTVRVLSPKDGALSAPGWCIQCPRMVHSVRH